MGKTKSCVTGTAMISVTAVDGFKAEVNIAPFILSDPELMIWPGNVTGWKVTITRGKGFVSRAMDALIFMAKSGDENAISCLNHMKFNHLTGILADRGPALIVVAVPGYASTLTSESNQRFSGSDDRSASPREELERLHVILKELGREALIEFDGSDKGSVISASLSGAGRDIEADLAERLIHLAPILIRCDLPGWDAGKGTCGRIRLDGVTEPWLDADDREDDWLMERTIDLDELDVAWPDDEKEAAIPAM